MLANCDQATQSKNSSNSIVIVKVFSSLTCPHCASFHTNIYEKLKVEYIDKGLVKFEHHAFPLDLAALNAEVVVRCQENNERKFDLLTEIYNKQTSWAVGSDINKINSLIKKIGLNFDLSNEKMDKCLKDDKSQDDILEQRIDAQKNIRLSLLQQLLLMKKSIQVRLIINNSKKLSKKNYR